MKVPFSWLKEFVDIDVTAQELEEKLFSCGFEVEELIPLDAGISKVVIRKTKTEFDVVDVLDWVQQEDDVPAL